MFVEKCKYIYNQQVQASLTTVALTHESTPSFLPTDSVPCVDEQSRKSQILHEMFEDSALSASFASDSNDSLLSPPASKRVTTSSIEASSLLPSTMMREGRFTDTQSPSKLLFTQRIFVLFMIINIRWQILYWSEWIRLRVEFILSRGRLDNYCTDSR